MLASCWGYKLLAYLNVEAPVTLMLRSFYIGISENVVNRWMGTAGMTGHRRGWDGMTVLYEASTSRQTGALERQLIAHFMPHSLTCHNVGCGGERASAGSPHYLYIVWKDNALLRFWYKMQSRQHFTLLEPSRAFLRFAALQHTSQ